MIFLTMTANNRFGTPDPAKEDIKERFSKETQKEQAHIVDEKIKRKTRPDYKGERKQVGFRLPIEIINDLAFLQFATNATQSSICEEALKGELKRRKKQLKNEDEEEYNQLIKLFERKR
jgi:predicted DNA-binding protein